MIIGACVTIGVVGSVGVGTLPTAPTVKFVLPHLHTWSFLLKDTVS